MFSLSDEAAVTSVLVFECKFGVLVFLMSVVVFDTWAADPLAGDLAIAADGLPVMSYVITLETNVEV